MLEGLGSIPEAREKKEKFEEASGSNEGSLGSVGGPHENMKITFLEIKLRKELGTSHPGGEIRNGQEWMSVKDGGSVETAEISTGPPGAIRFRDHEERTGSRKQGPLSCGTQPGQRPACLGPGSWPWQ